jgi:S-formylglutathione hydrolase FrmB
VTFPLRLDAMWGVVDHDGLRHAVSRLSLLHGWLPVALQVVTGVGVLMILGRRSSRWRGRGLPLAAVVGTGVAAVAHWYLDSLGVAGDPAPRRLWLWLAASGAAFVAVVLGWAGARWWRRTVLLTAVPLCALCAALALNGWVGYFPTVHALWSQLNAGPLPDETDRLTVTEMQIEGTRPDHGVVVPVWIDGTTGFKHRRELVYLPPAWFGQRPPPKLPTVMMIAAQLNTPADWLRAGGAVETIDAFAAAHDGFAPVFVFVDATGAFDNDTECVDGPRGKAADHLTRDVVPFMESDFGVRRDATSWAAVGWSMGGTCAVDLATMHPELFSTFVDIGGDAGPNTGSRQQTIATLFGGDENAWASYDPTTVIGRHQRYDGVVGWFSIASNPVPPGTSDPIGNPEGQDVAARTLCSAASAKGIRCAIVGTPGRHDWPFAANAFADALPWLSGHLHTQDVPQLPLPDTGSAAPARS